MWILSPAGLRRHGADERVESRVKSGVCFHSSWFTLVWFFFSVRDVGEHLQFCSLLFSIFYSLLYLFREGLLRTHVVFQPGLKFMQPKNVPLSSKTGSKTHNNICFFQVFQ